MYIYLTPACAWLCQICRVHHLLVYVQYLAACSLLRSFKAGLQLSIRLAPVPIQSMAPAAAYICMMSMMGY